MPNSKLPTNFQLNILIFNAKASLRILLQSAKYYRVGPAPPGQEGNFWDTFSNFKKLKY